MLIGKDQHSQASGSGRGREKTQAETLHEHQGEEGGRRNRQGHAGTSSQGGTRVGTLRLGHGALMLSCAISLFFLAVADCRVSHERKWLNGGSWRAVGVQACVSCALRFFNRRHPSASAQALASAGRLLGVCWARVLACLRCLSLAPDAPPVYVWCESNVCMCLECMCVVSTSTPFGLSVVSICTPFNLWAPTTRGVAVGDGIDAMMIHGCTRSTIES